MTLIPFAEKKLIRPGPSDPPIIPIGIIWHVDAGNAHDLHDYFRYRSGGIESHGHIRLDGHLYQYRDTGYEADANLKANSFWKDGKRYGYLSFETQGYGDGKWTAEQLETIARVNRWGHEEHGIPLRVCRNPQDPGIGYHTLFGSPSDWTPQAKSCPGPERIKQFNNILVPSWTTKEDTMALDNHDKQWIRDTIREEIRAVFRDDETGQPDLSNARVNDPFKRPDNDRVNLTLGTLLYSDREDIKAIREHIEETVLPALTRRGVE